MSRSRRRGQGLVEYGLLVGMVGLLLVGAVQALRGSMGKAYGTVTGRLDGVGHRISGRTTAPEDAAPVRRASSQVIEGKTHEGHGGEFERRMILDEVRGTWVSVEVCVRCGEPR